MGVYPQGTFPRDVPRGRGDKMDITLEGPPPKIWDGEKNVKNSARFLTTFEFDRECLRKGSTYRKSEKYLHNYNLYHVGQKKFVNFGPQTKKL